MEEASKLASAFGFDEMIEISLEDGGNFTVQRALLCSTSDYFRSALLGTFAEAKDKKLRLPGFETDLFELFLYWMCHRSLPDFTKSMSSLGEAAFDEAGGKLQVLLSRLWHMAGMYLIPVLQNDTMLGILEVLEYVDIVTPALEIAFDRGSDECPLRKMFLTEFVCSWESTLFHAPGYMAEFADIPGFFTAFAAMVYPTVGRSQHTSVRHKTPDSTYMVPT